MLRSSVIIIIIITKIIIKKGWLAQYFDVTQLSVVNLLELKVNEDWFYPITYKGNKYWGFLETGIRI